MTHLDKAYFKFTESCAWEGEKWSFFFPLKNNFTAMIWLTRISAEANNQYEKIKSATPEMPSMFFKTPKIFAASKYYIDSKLYSLEEAQSFCARQRIGYMVSEIFKGAKLNASAIQKKVLWIYPRFDQDPLYKGGIRNFINKKTLQAAP